MWLVHISSWNSTKIKTLLALYDKYHNKRRFIHQELSTQTYTINIERFFNFSGIQLYFNRTAFTRITAALLYRAGTHSDDEIHQRCELYIVPGDG
jgi:hypothetical protein